ncbi:PAS domain-containing sensor histidine kinase [Rhodovibrionaceae bacterium A322]
MTIRFKDRLSYKQALIALAVVLVVGTLLAGCRIYLDYRSSLYVLNLFAARHLTAAEETAVIALAEDDRESADRLMRSLLTFPLFYEARLEDSSGKVVARLQQPEEKVLKNWLADWFSIIPLNPHERILVNAGDSASLGRITAWADHRVAFDHTYQKISTFLALSYVQSLAVAAVLWLAFYLVLTKRLEKITRFISAKKSGDSLKPPRLKHKTGRDDELDVLLRAFTQHLEEEQDRETRFQDFLEISSDWLWEMDADLRFTFFSDRTSKITGYDPSTMLGKTRREISSENTHTPKWDRHLQDLDNHLPIRNFRYTVKQEDDSDLSVSVSGKPIFDEQGTFLGYRGTGTDYTAQRQAERARDAALQDAEQANKAKSDFLATMSHEFRTPLNAILGFSDMMRAQFFGPLGSDNYRSYAEDIHASGEHMLALVNDVLDVAAIEAGKRQYNKEPCDLEAMIGDSLRNLEQLAINGKVSLRARVPDDLPLLFADQRSLRQILLNLLSNAIKFTPQGGSVEVEAKASSTAISICVTDTGVGIPADKLATITKPFSQLNNALQVSQNGTGLGLSIVQSLVEAHDGQLTLSSEEGKGTEVTVSLPL